MTILIHPAELSVPTPGQIPGGKHHLSPPVIDGNLVLFYNTADKRLEVIIATIPVWCKCSGNINALQAFLRIHHNTIPSHTVIIVFYLEPVRTRSGNGKT